MRFDLLTELKLAVFDAKFKAEDLQLRHQSSKELKEKEHDKKIEEMAKDILKKEEAMRAEKECSENQL